MLVKNFMNLRQELLGLRIWLRNIKFKTRKGLPNHKRNKMIGNGSKYKNKAPLKKKHRRNEL